MENDDDGDGDDVLAELRRDAAENDDELNERLLLGDLPRPSRAQRLTAAALAQRHNFVPRPPKRMMLPFEAAPEDSGYMGLGYTRVFTSHPQCIFKPKGLMIWGAPDDADVNQIWVGKNLQVVAALGPIPAKWFSMAQSYEQIEKALADGIEPPSWPDFDAVQVAQTVQVSITSQNKLPPIKLVMWGLGIQ